MSVKPISQDFRKAFSAHPHLLNEIVELKGAHLFITGGTGFFGCWLLESLDWIVNELKVDLKATVLTRNPNAFRKKAPHLAKLPFVKLHRGDVKDFEFPRGRFTHVIHAATESSTQLNAENPLEMFDTILGGTRRALDFAVKRKVKRFLLTSSGAIYGRQSPQLNYLSEDTLGAPDPLAIASAYSEGKRAAEYLCAAYTKSYEIEAAIARCFAFVGPYLALDAHFAIGNFIRDSIRGGPIRVGGDGTPFRSYLYGVDLAVWLWGILLLGKPSRAYNVGSEEAFSIREIAETVAKANGKNLKVEIAKQPVPGVAAERYIPSSQRARDELNLRQIFSLEDAISRTLDWNQLKKS